MSDLMLVFFGFILGVVATIGFFCWLGQAQVNRPPHSREAATAKVMLHRARRDRELAELDRQLKERAEKRLRRLADE